MELDQVVALFKRGGGTFLSAPESFQRKIRQVRALVFDWDGVFNRGEKGEGTNSPFSEPDSMGSNMLRYGFWRAKEKMPVTAIITGIDNRSAMHLARREHFQGVYLGIKRKPLALNHLCAGHNLRSEQIACFFDDINDLEMAATCGVRILMNRSASPMFRHHVEVNGLADYITGSDAGRYGVRESAELFLAMLGSYEEVVASRVAWDSAYQKYLTERQSILTLFYNQRGNNIRPAADST